MVAVRLPSSAAALCDTVRTSGAISPRRPSHGSGALAVTCQQSMTLSEPRHIPATLVTTWTVSVPLCSPDWTGLVVDGMSQAPRCHHAAARDGNRIAVGRPPRRNLARAAAFDLPRGERSAAPDCHERRAAYLEQHDRRGPRCRHRHPTRRRRADRSRRHRRMQSPNVHGRLPYRYWNYTLVTRLATPGPRPRLCGGEAAVVQEDCPKLSEPRRRASSLAGWDAAELIPAEWPKRVAGDRQVRVAR